MNPTIKGVDLIDEFRLSNPPSPKRVGADHGAKEGWLFKRSNRIASKRQKWSKEYISLQGATLRIMKKDTIAGTNRFTDVKKSYQLSQYCTVGEIYIREKKVGGIEPTTSSNSVVSATSCDESAILGVFSGEEEDDISQATMHTSNNQSRPKSDTKKTLFCIQISWLTGKVRGERDCSVIANDSEEPPDNVSELAFSNTELPRELILSETSGVRRRGSPLNRKRQTRQVPLIEPDPDHDQDSLGKHSETEIVPVLCDSDDDAMKKRNGGIERHYSQQLKLEQIDQKVIGEKMVKIMFLQKKRAKRKKNLQRVAKGGIYAAAATTTAALGLITAGIALGVGLGIIGITAAVGGTSAAAQMGYRKTKGNTVVILAAATLKEAKEWKNALEIVINSYKGNDSDVCTNKEHPRYVSFNIEEDRKDDFGDKGVGALRSEADYSEPITRWEPLDGGWQSLLGFGTGGLRVYREEEKISKHTYLGRLMSKDENYCGPLLKSQIIFNASPLNAFMSLMSNGNVSAEQNSSTTFPNSGQRASFRIIETLDENSDIIHLFFRPTYLFPFWTKARDFVLFRHWRYDSDKTYSVVYHSVSHPDCPPISTHIRGKMDAIYSIAPEKIARTGESRCLLTQLVQVDPKGWIPFLRIPLLPNQGYNEVFAISTMSIALDVRDALDFDAFVSVSLSSKPYTWEGLKLRYAKSVLPTETGNISPSRSMEHIDEYSVLSSLPINIGPTPNRTNTTVSLPNDYSVEDEYNNYDFRYRYKERIRDRCNSYSSTDLMNKSINNNPAPCNEEKWAEPDANSFRIRGENYMVDRIKINGGDSLFHLVAVDIYKVENQMLTGVCLHPEGRMQMALASEKEAKAKGIDTDVPPFVFTVNLSVRGPPSYNMVFFFAVDDMALIDGTSGTPSSKLSREFFFGDSDEFRDKTFKLIPQIVEGNFVVRKAARSTPVIMGKKLKQYYCRDERFCEVTVDMGSSSVANGAIRLCNGFSKSIVVDLAFLLESNDKSMLPEKILGCVRMKNMSLCEDSKPLSEVN